VQPNSWFSRKSIAESTYGMVLHRPVELARVTGNLGTGTHFTGYGSVNQDQRIEDDPHQRTRLRNFLVFASFDLR
jgi:hypothetical protein